MSAESSTLYLVRHGATDANLRKPYVLQGHGLDLALSDTGRGQAERVAQLLGAKPIAAVYSSPMRRARETAQAVAARCRREVVVQDALIECNVGRWEGMSWDQIREKFPRECADFERDPGVFPYLGGETYGDVARRAVPVLEQLLERHRGQQFVVVAHNIVNRALVATFLGLELRLSKELHLANGGVNVIRREGEHTRLVTLNSAFHLENDWQP